MDAFSASEVLPDLLVDEDRVLEGSPEVLGLLETNPFPGKPPRYVRAESEYYTFTIFGDEAKGLWWKTTPGPVYCPSASLRER